VVLLTLHESELLFLKDFHASLFEGFTADHTEKRLNFFIEKEKFVIFN
jgi:hypothetical protein